MFTFIENSKRKGEQSIQKILAWKFGQNSRPASRVETGMSVNFLSCSKSVKNPLEVPEVRCD